MGLLSRIFGGDESPDAALIKEYCAAFQMNGFSPSEAKTMAKDFVQQGKAEVARRGWAEQPPSYGDALLKQEATDPKIHAAFEAIRAEGVRNEDIRAWWNMSALERVLLEKSDEMNRMTGFVGLRKQGIDAAEAARRVFKGHPKFGDPLDGEGDDRPIPIELKLRIVQFMERNHNSLESLKRRGTCLPAQ